MVCCVFPCEYRSVSVRAGGDLNPRNLKWIETVVVQCGTAKWSEWLAANTPVIPLLFYTILRLIVDHDDAKALQVPYYKCCGALLPMFVVHVCFVYVCVCVCVPSVFVCVCLSV